MKIEKCPFCGGEASYRDDGQWEKVYDEGGAIVDIDINNPSVFIVECSCGVQIISDESEEIVCTAWNRRVDTMQVVRGEWEPANPICPVCGEDKFKGLDADIWSDWTPAYCPNCGAKMEDKP